MKCVHCLKEAGDTMDHVFPKSWYPDSTPENMPKPKVPSCKKCNNDLGKIEDIVFNKLAPCIDPHKIAALGIKIQLFKRFGIGGFFNK
jgi:hypothetical protein